MIFTGEHEHTIDDKQRVAIPSAIRARLNPEKHGEGFYLVTGPNGALWIWPEREFERIADQLERSLMPSEEALDFDEVTFPDATHVEMDKVGRIRIPERMLGRAGFRTGANVLIVGMRDHLELRDPAEWERTRSEREARRREIYLRARRAVQRERRDSLDVGEGSSGAGDRS